MRDQAGQVRTKTKIKTKRKDIRNEGKRGRDPIPSLPRINACQQTTTINKKARTKKSNRNFFCLWFGCARLRGEKDRVFPRGKKNARLCKDWAVGVCACCLCLCLCVQFE